jgi:DNA polymerase III epsilon subunit-like protein
MSNLVYIDFESYFDSKSFTLKKVSMFEYIRSPLFKAHGVGVAEGNSKAYWVSRADLENFFSQTWADTTFVAHNMKFDGAIAAWLYGAKPASYICTQAMARAVFGHTLKSHSLAKVAEHYGLEPKGHMLTDGLIDLTPQQEDELATYCKHDVELCREIHRRMAEKFPAGQYSALDWTIRAFVEPKLVLNPVVLEQAWTDEKVRRENIFTQIGIPKEVFASNKRFPELLTSKGYEVPVKRSPKQKNADGSAKEIPALALGDEAFLAMRDSEDDTLADLCEARIAAKSTLLETRCDKFLKLSTLGAFPFDVNYSGAKQTHRYSGGSGAGGNPQNLQQCREHKKLPPDHQCRGALRKAVEAPAGYKLVVGDYAGIELRIVAWLANETQIMYAITEDKDLYCGYASDYYGRTITKNDMLERAFGKEAMLGLGYQMGATKFAARVKIKIGTVLDEVAGRNAIDLYRTKYWHVPALWQLLQDKIPLLARKESWVLPNLVAIKGRNGEVVLPSGLTLKYPNLRKVITGPNRSEWIYDGKENVTNLYGGKLLENISQALAGEICKIGIERAEKAGLTVVGQVHDEIVCIAKDEDATMARLTLQKAMEAPIPWWPYLRLKAEVGVGQDWREAK